MTMRTLLLIGGLGAALTGCFGDDKGDDSGDDGDDGTDGADGADGQDGAGDGTDGTADGTDGTGDGADGGGATLGTVAGAMALFPAGEAWEDYLGVWSISGDWVDCSGCEFAFDADFTAVEGGVSDASFYVTFEDGYVYTDAGDYWGTGYLGYGSYGSYAIWYNYYDAYYNGNYGYYGYVYYY